MRGRARQRASRRTCLPAFDSLLLLILEAHDAPRAEVEVFRNSVDELRDDVARLEARICQMEKDRT